MEARGFDRLVSARPSFSNDPQAALLHQPIQSTLKCPLGEIQFLQHQKFADSSPCRKPRYGFVDQGEFTG
jgi:hypothetical protein